MNQELTDKDVALMLKAALEYNAGILAIATSFYGNVGTSRSQKRLRESLINTSKAYRKQLMDIIGLEDDGINNK